MKSRSLPLVLFMAFVAAANASPALALPPSSDTPPPVRVEIVDDRELAGLTGKFYGADMLVGVRIDLVSHIATAQGGTATAAGSMYVQRNASGGFDVVIDSRADAVANTSDAPATSNVAIGGQNLHVDGIGQVVQIAGDGNRMTNVAIVRLDGAPAAPAGFNGQPGAQADAGGLHAQVSFTGGGVQLGLVAPGATIGQQVMPGGAGQVMQLGQIAGDGFTASNTLQLQMATSAIPTMSLQQLGIQQALSAVSGLRR